MSLRKYRVTVMDNWTPTGHFWTLRGAYKFACQHCSCAHVFKWIKGWGWSELKLSADGTPTNLTTV